MTVLFSGNQVRTILMAFTATSANFVPFFVACKSLIDPSLFTIKRNTQFPGYFHRKTVGYCFFE